jgi:23S rRNA (guanine745-N1)-methyltransferase
VLVCPICCRGLSHDGPRYRCPTGHSFDIARQGYVNLLRAPYSGDSRAMVQARRAFLDGGRYQPLTSLLTRRVLDHLTAGDRVVPAAVLEVGCGEGTYIGAVAAAAHSQRRAITCFGLDVAKDAVTMAAKRHRGVQFVVANVNDRLPFADASLGALLVVFAPRNPAEFARSLAPGGLLLIAMPAPSHLAEARAAYGLLDVEPEKQRRLHARLAPNFDLAGSEAIEYPMTLGGDGLAQLILMSPSAHHIAPERLALARQTDRFVVSASFVVQRYLRRVTA